MFKIFEKNMIPKNIKKEHILLAIKENKKNDTPPQRKSKNYWLVYRNAYYAPKYILSLANKYANGKELESTDFHGGKESNNYLISLGFYISKSRILTKPIKQHNERCKLCKETIKIILEKIYGRIEINHKFKVGTSPEDFKDSKYYNSLKKIYKALQKHRGFRNIIRANTLPNCDYFIPNPGFILEFDESQHFSIPRKVALINYPKNIILGFNKNKWISLCQKINANDNDPPYRDEQRAWYDTLRDLVPEMKSLRPTIRLYSKDLLWCKLSPKNKKDIHRFKNIIGGESKKENINASIARIILKGEWEGDEIKAREIFKNIYKKWPKDKKVKFLITCGGFLQFEWPQSISQFDIGDNKFPKSNIVDILIKEAEKCVRNVINSDVRNKLIKVTDYLTLGIDSYKNEFNSKEPHIELVCLIDLRNNNIYWTGKSYPMVSQQNGLIRIADLKSHFLNIKDIGKLMILGCHDLTIFNPRTKCAKGWREKENKKFQIMTEKEKPRIVLQHPHSTDSIRTWASAWTGLKRIAPMIEKYASAGRYFNCEGERDDLTDILKKTRYGDTIDFIVQIKNSKYNLIYS